MKKTNLGVTITLEPYDSKALSALVNNKQYSWAIYGLGARIIPIRTTGCRSFSMTGAG